MRELPALTGSVAYPHRVAMISMHTSPLATPGVGDAGGLNVYVAEVARRLGERGLKVDVFTRTESTPTPDIVELNEHTRVINIPAGPAEPVAKEVLPELVHAFGTQLDAAMAGYGLIHSHYWLSGMVGAQLRMRHGIPLVHTMHTMARVKNAARGNGHLVEPDDRERGEAAIVAAAEALTANTSDESAELQRHYGARSEQIVIVPPGVDLHTFHPCDQPKSRAQFGIPEDAQVILFVGRIQPLKAPDTLIRAVAELARREPRRRSRLRLMIIGSPSGPDAAWSLTLPPLAAQLGVADLVEFRPHSERGELFRWYCASDVVGVPSFNESFGLVALEAQACGRPVVATDVSGLRHAVGDQQTGLLVAGHEPEGWADALAAVLDHPDEMVRMGANAAAHASRFSWDNTASATLRAYALALDTHRAADPA
jgi:D-inositol-3-phosphate glycosyltransferase